MYHAVWRTDGGRTFLSGTIIGGNDCYYFGAFMVLQGRQTARLDGDFVVFLIGMRFNRWWAIHRWLPVIMAMPRMLKELYTHKALGFLHHEMWVGRTVILVQYWRSKEQLLAYARNTNAQHVPAWRAFNRAVGADGSVGIWHETYLATAGTYENIYANMPPFGLGKVGTLEAVGSSRESASARFATS